MENYFKEHIDELIRKYASGDLSINESEELLNWVDQEDRKDYFREQLFMLQSKSGTVGPDKDEAYIDLQGRLGRKNSSRIKVMYYAAAAIVLILISVSAFLFFLFPSEEVFTNLIASDRNMNIILDDNSDVCIRKGSLIAVPNKFNKGNCNVILKGQAFFKVTKKEDCQFIVKTGSISTKVVGTAFDLKYDTITGDVRISLEEGRVDVYSNDSLIKKMKAMDQLCVSQYGKVISFKTLENRNYKSYITHLLEFNQSPVNEVARDLSDYYGIPFIIANKEIENCMLTSRMDSATIDEVKFIFEKALNTKIISLEDKIVLHGEGCSK